MNAVAKAEAPMTFTWKDHWYAISDCGRYTIARYATGDGDRLEAWFRAAVGATERVCVNANTKDEAKAACIRHRDGVSA